MYKNRILISLGLVVGFTFLGAKSFATSTGVVNTETARMRAEANTTSNIVALVSQDEKVEILEKSGLKVSGTSPDGLLVEIVEIPEHPYFIAGQFHPELKSRPNNPHPLFKKFVGAALNNK